MPARTFPKPIEASFNNIEARFNNNGSLKLANGGSGMTGVATASYSGHGISVSVRKWGNVVFVNFTGTTDSSLETASATIVTLASAYRPAVDVQFLAQHPDNVSMVRMIIDTDGILKSPHTLTSSKSLRGSVCYVI